MSKLKKRPLPTSPTTLALPIGGRFLAFASVVEPRSASPDHYAWTEEPTDARVGATSWVIWTLMTGDNVPPEAQQHLGSHVGWDQHGFPYVTHYYGTAVA